MARRIWWTSNLRRFNLRGAIHQIQSTYLKARFRQPFDCICREPFAPGVLYTSLCSIVVGSMRIFAAECWAFHCSLSNLFNQKRYLALFNFENAFESKVLVRSNGYQAGLKKFKLYNHLLLSFESLQLLWTPVETPVYSSFTYSTLNMKKFSPDWILLNEHH